MTARTGPYYQIRHRRQPRQPHHLSSRSLRPHTMLHGRGGARLVCGITFGARTAPTCVESNVVIGCHGGPHDTPITHDMPTQSFEPVATSIPLPPDGTLAPTQVPTPVPIPTPTPPDAHTCANTTTNTNAINGASDSDQAQTAKRFDESIVGHTDTFWYPCGRVQRLCGRRVQR